MAHVRDFLNLLVAQAGDAYKFGVEVPASDADPAAFDCSELIQWAGSRVKITPPMPDGSWLQYRHVVAQGQTLTPAEAVALPGGLLFKFSSNPMTGGRPSSAHVAVSLGDGRTIEARSTAHGTGVFSAGGRGWTHAGRVPGLEYGGPLPPAWVAAAWRLYLKGWSDGGPAPADPVTHQQLAHALYGWGGVYTRLTEE